MPSRTVRGRSLLLAALVLGACALPGQASRPAPLLHLVTMQLTDPESADELLADLQRLLRPIPSVVSFSAGPPVDTGRENVDDDYDVALLVGFEDVAGYQLYLEHPDHLELLRLWRARLRGLDIKDFAAIQERGVRADRGTGDY